MKSLRKSKKGIAFNVTMMIPRFIFLVVVSLAIVVMVRSFVITNIDTGGAEAKIFAERVMYSSSALAYYDEDIDRVYPGVVDMGNFVESRLENSIKYPNPRVLAANITLYDKNQRRVMESVYYNEVWYKNWYPKAVSGVSGSGGVGTIEITKPVIYKNSTSENMGFLVFEVLMPNG